VRNSILGVWQLLKRHLCVTLALSHWATEHLHSQTSAAGAPTVRVLHDRRSGSTAAGLTSAQAAVRGDV
jgi:hypothetical protein